MAWLSPTGHDIPDPITWRYISRAYDDNTGTFTYSIGINLVTGEWNIPFLVLTHAVIKCDKVRFWISNTDFDLVDIDVYYGGAWHDAYEGVYTPDAWTEVELSVGEQSITKARLRTRSAITASNRALRCYEFDFWGPIILTGIASSEAFGTLKVNHIISPTGIVSAEAFGTAKAVHLQHLLPDAIASAEAFGTATLLLYILPTGIASLEAFGTTIISQEELTLLYKTFTEGQVDGIRVKFPNTGGAEKSVYVHEMDFLITSPPIFLLPAAIASAEAFGTLTTQLYILPSGIASLEALGVPVVEMILIFNGIASAEAFGTTWLINSSLSVVVGRELLPVRFKIRIRLLDAIRLVP